MNVDLTGLNRSVDAACDEIDRLRAQRDELLAALKEIRAIASKAEDAHPELSHPSDIIDRVDAAITKAEG